MEFADPKDYQLDNWQRMELETVFNAAQLTILSDLKIYCDHPDWFVVNEENGHIEYARNAHHRIIQAHRQIGVDEKPEQLLHEIMQFIDPNVGKIIQDQVAHQRRYTSLLEEEKERSELQQKKLSGAAQALQVFFKNAGEVKQMRMEIGALLPDISPILFTSHIKCPFWYQLEEMHSKMIDVRLLAGMIPQTCIDTAQALTDTLATPTTRLEQERIWANMARAERGAITLGHAR